MSDDVYYDIKYLHDKFNTFFVLFLNWDFDNLICLLFHGHKKFTNSMFYDKVIFMIYYTKPV